MAPGRGRIASPTIDGRDSSRTRPANTLLRKLIPGGGLPSRDHLRAFGQAAAPMPNGLPTGRNGVPRIPLITPAAEAYQATSAVRMPT